MAKLYPIIQPSSQNDYLEPTWKRVPRDNQPVVIDNTRSIQINNIPNIDIETYWIYLYYTDDLSNFTPTEPEDIIFYNSSTSKWFDKEHTTYELLDEGLQLFGLCKIEYNIDGTPFRFRLMNKDEQFIRLNTGFITTSIQPHKLWYGGIPNSEPVQYGFFEMPNSNFEPIAWYVDVGLVYIKNEPSPINDRTVTLIEPHNKLHIRK